MTAAPHVAIDCRVVAPAFPGIGRATLETVRAMVEASVPGRLSLLVGPDQTPAELAGLADRPAVEIVTVESALRALADQWRLPLLLRRLRPDLYHATYYAAPIAVPGRMIVTIYDLIPRLFPAYWPRVSTRLLINAWTALAARRAAGVLACSHATAADIVRLLPAAAAKVSVAPLGVSHRPSLDAPLDVNRQHLSDAPFPPQGPPMLLYVGSNKPHKNLPRLVEAFARLEPASGARLVIAGTWEDRYPEARDRADRLGLAGRVVFEHRPTDRRLDELFTQATAFVFPSLYEGFGLPVLEAMAAGIPVATTDRGSLGEVAADAALRFDPLDVDAIAGAMSRLLDDAALRADLSARGRARAAQFPWSETARLTWAAYERVLSRSGRP